MPTAADVVSSFLDAHPALKLLGLVAFAALVRDHPAYRWLRYPLIPVGMAAAAYRLKLLLRASSSSSSNAPPLPPSLLAWAAQQLPAMAREGIGAVVLQDAVAILLLLFVVRVARRLRRLCWREVKAQVGDGVFAMLRDLPPVRKQLEAETAKLEATLEHSLRPEGWLMGHAPIRALPPKGLPAGEVLKQMRAYAGKEETKWKAGLVSGAVYGGEADIVALMGEASSLYGLSNPLHPDLFPSVMRYEAEVCAMVAQLVGGGDPGVVAALTSGGTESIILAAKTHRDFYRETKGITEPEIVACISAHAAIQKAADLMGIRLVLIPMDPVTYRADVRAMERAITSNTILLYASAPTFGQGAIDPVEAIGALGVKYDVGVHVDCCLGGFILPFARQMGFDGIPRFDFGVPGVTSMSVDTHKYGYAAKGTSCVVYRSKELRRYQYFCFPAWTGGLYVTPTIAGSRPGALSAACWAALVAIGADGYQQRTKSILETTRRIAQGVDAIPGLRRQGDSKAMIVCVTGDEAAGVNIYEVGDRMAKKGWNLNSLQSPPGLHLCVTLRHVGKHDAFLSDLREAAAAVLEEAKANGGRKGKASGNAAIYGMAATLPAGPVNDMLRTYTDVVLS